MPKDLIPMSPRTPWRLFLSTVKYRIIMVMWTKNCSYNKIKIALTTKSAAGPRYNFRCRKHYQGGHGQYCSSDHAGYFSHI